MTEAYVRAAELVARSRRGVAFTGAGISAESGIPTFRDPGGIWDQFDMEEVGTTPGLLKTIARHPLKIKEFIKSTVETFEKAAPHAGHTSLKDLEDLGIIKTVITQNVDDLHSIAGSSHVIEVHGNLYRARCISCGRRKKLTREEVLSKAREVLEEKIFNPLKLAGVFPKCECGGMSRPDVVMFGEAVQGLHEAYQAASSCDLMLILGTSGVVYPAAALPYEARRHGAKVIEINPTANAFREITDVFIQAKAGEGMPRLVKMVRELLAQ